MVKERSDRRHPRARSCAVESAAGSTPLSPIYTCEWCFGPLEVAYDYDAIAAAISREKIAAGPPSLWRYSDLLPVACDPSVDLGTGFTPLVRADRLAAELGLGEVWLKNDTRNPTNSFKDRVVSIALSKALEFGFKVAACASTGNLANSVAAHAAHAGLRSYVFIPSNLEQGKIVTTVGLRRQRRRDRRQLRRRQPSVRRARRHLRVGVREREHAAVLRRGLEDARVRDRRAARLAACPITSSCRSRAVRCSPRSSKGFERAPPGRPARRRAARARVGRAGARLLADRDGVHREVRHDPAGEARHDRQVARDRQPGRRLLRARRRAQQRRRVRGGERRRDRRRDGAARAHRGHLRRDRGRRDDRDAEEARGRRRRSGPTSVSSCTSPVTG